MARPVYAEYKKHIRALVAEYGRQGILTGPFPLLFLPAQGVSAEEGGVVRAKDPSLKFKDGAILLLQEEVRIANNEVELLRYSYHYERPNGYFFRYERESTTDSLRKPEYHMHVILDLPHFAAPSVNLEIILKMIAVNFYSQDIYSRQIIGHEVHLIV